MKCLKCGSDVIYVVNSRPSEVDGLHTTRRRRICRKCKFRWSTVEVLMGDRRRSSPLHDAAAMLVSIRNDLQEIIMKIDEINSRGEVK